jgi:hypothetical protein
LFIFPFFFSGLKFLATILISSSSIFELIYWPVHTKILGDSSHCCEWLGWRSWCRSKYCLDICS